MHLIKPKKSSHWHVRGGYQSSRGFALVISLSLMVLLTVLAVGLLTLSTISVRTSSQGLAMGIAKANARLSLMLAIGDLQKKAGPDQRVTAPANLVDPSHPMGLTGVWRSWRPDPLDVSDGDYPERKTGDNFLGYLISNPEPSGSVAPDEIPGGDLTRKLVGEGTVGSDATDKEISAPVILTKSGSTASPEGGLAWVAMDENVKARLDLEPGPEESSLGDQIAALGAPARNHFSQVKALDYLEGLDAGTLKALLPKLVSLKEAEIESSSPSDLAGHFHDFTVSSASLQTNVADGGLKTDLSILFEGDFRDSLPGDFDSRYLYSDTSTPFPNSASNSDIRWSLYANYARLYKLGASANGSVLTGLKAKPPATYRLRTINDRTFSPPVVRYEPRMALISEPVLMPTVIRVDTMFSIVARKAHQGRGTSTYPYMLHLMYLPVITLHNPYNVPLRCSDLQVEFSDIPIGFQFVVNGQPANTGGLVPLNKLYIGTQAKKTFSVTLSTSLSTNAEVLMGPGETRIFGTPFSKDATWASEVAANGAVMFDWQNNKTSNVRMIPGMITGPNDGIGFDVDWLAPDPRAPWVNSRRNEGVLLLKGDDRIQVRFGPVMPAAANGSFTITMKMLNQETGRTQVFYKDQSKLDPLLSEGVSPRFPDARTFPATFPEAGAAPLLANRLVEEDGVAFKRYANARPFAVFSVGAKTTVESFTKARPVADNGIAFQMATCDFRESTSQGSSPLEFALVPVKNGSAAIESDEDKGFFFGGHGSTSGTTAATIYEIPLAPLQSIAQLRHANGASIGISPLVTYSVGESRANPSIPSEVTHLADGQNIALDHSWLANTTLWDGYWFSTLCDLQGPAYSGASSLKRSELAKQFFAGTKPLPNPRNTPYFPAGKPAVPDQAAEAAVEGLGKSSAAYMVTEGGFNVNSTSVPAWTAALSALAGSDVPIVKDETSETNADSPFPRHRRPVLGTVDPDASPKEKLWNSYRTLAPEEITTLAERIVDEVRTRGPFLSMAEFVNRRIGEPGELTRAGALQAALDKSGVNAIMESNARSVTEAEVEKYGWKNPDAVTGNTGAGSPGEISQGDILTVMGSFATVRSDTFVVRGYGDARDPDGRILAKAWCEATVQRVPEYVDPSEPPEAIATSDANVRFGRSFKIVAFRWLSPEEI